MALRAPEDIARQVVSLWEDNYSASLTIVKDARDSTETVVLPDFVDRRLSASPEIMPKMWESPLMQVGIGPMEETDEAPRYEQYHSEYDLEVQIFYFLKHPDNRTLSLQIMRHTEATLDLLNKHQALGFSGRDRVVAGSLQLVPSTTAPLGQNVLVKGLMVRFRFRLMQYGF